MTQTYYHGTDERITAIDRDICLTEDYDIAVEYLQGRAGRVYTITVANDRLADEGDIRDAALAVYGSEEKLEQAHGIGPWMFELIDTVPIRDQLTADGYVGCVYRDATPGNGREHLTVRIWATSAEITGSEEIREDM